jgi:hypothetical protein
LAVIILTESPSEGQVPKQKLAVAENHFNFLTLMDSSHDSKKAIPLQIWTGPEGSRRLRLPDFKTVGT